MFAAISQRRRFPSISLAFHRVSCRQIFSLKASKIFNSLLGVTIAEVRTFTLTTKVDDAEAPATAAASSDISTSKSRKLVLYYTD